jgi:hypothetical protein
MTLKIGVYRCHPAVYVDTNEMRYWDGNVWSVYVYPWDPVEYAAVIFQVESSHVDMVVGEFVNTLDAFLYDR